MDKPGEGLNGLHLGEVEKRHFTSFNHFALMKGPSLYFFCGDAVSHKKNGYSASLKFGAHN